MILKGRTRGNGQQLASYLLSSKNEQVRVLDVRGTVETDRTPDGLKKSLADMEEIGKMTRSQSTLFHLAINPNDRDRLTREDWQYSVAKAEKALGLEGQPRAVVSHVHDGKEHLHVVWSRVDIENRKCVEMSFSNLKLCSAAREIEIELGLQQTPARARGAHRLNQHIKEIQQYQDERTAQPREQRNAIVQNAWDNSQTGAEFKQQIEAAGYQLARGNRGVVVMDTNNEPHAIARCVEGIKAKDVKAKLADVGELPTVEELRPAKKARKTKTGDAKASDPTRREAQQLTERGAAERGLTDNPTMADPDRRQAKDATADQVQRDLTAANDNAAEQEQEQATRRDYRQHRPRF